MIMSVYTSATQKTQMVLAIVFFLSFDIIFYALHFLTHSASKDATFYPAHKKVFQMTKTIQCNYLTNQPKYSMQ